MDKSTAAAWLPLVAALAEGRTLQYRPKGEDIEYYPFSRHKWTDRAAVNLTGCPDRYRVKPREPRKLYAHSLLNTLTHPTTDRRYIERKVAVYGGELVEYIEVIKE